MCTASNFPQTLQPALEHVTLSLSLFTTPLWSSFYILWGLLTLGGVALETPQWRMLPSCRALLLVGWALGGSAVSTRHGLSTNCSFLLTLVLSQADLCPPRTSPWMPTGALQTFPEEPEAANLFPFSFSASLHPCCVLQTGKSARQSLPTLGPLILLITRRAAGNSVGLSREAAIPKWGGS